MEGAEFVSTLRDGLANLEDEIARFLGPRVLAGKKIPASVKTSFGTFQLVERTDKMGDGYIDVVLPILTFDPDKF